MYCYQSNRKNGIENKRNTKLFKVRRRRTNEGECEGGNKQNKKIQRVYLSMLVMGTRWSCIVKISKSPAVSIVNYPSKLKIKPDYILKKVVEIP